MKTWHSGFTEDLKLGGLLKTKDLKLGGFNENLKLVVY